MMSYFSSKNKGKRRLSAQEKIAGPVLNDEDEEFLRRITAQVEGDPPPLPDRPQDLSVAGESQSNDAQVMLFQGAQDIPLPDAPDTPMEESSREIGGGEVVGGKKGKGKGKEKDKKAKWPSFLRRDSKSKGKSGAANVPLPASPSEATKEQDEMERVLEQLNLAAVDNRVFSFSTESRELLRNFTLVLKDLVHGVPTAYGDLESLLTNSEGQLQKMFGVLPAFMQQMIQKLPEKFTQSLGPEFLAAAAEKQGLKSDYLTKGAETAGKMGIKVKVPNLKDLVTKQGAIAGLLRAIMNFLRQRFPAVLGVNVLWSLAISVLLLVFWYCHKRGKEVRLAKEREVTEAEMAAIKAQVEADAPGEYHADADASASTIANGRRTTTAPEGAPTEEVQAGMREAEAAHSQASYAEGGSLASAIREDEAAKKESQEAQAGKAVEQRIAAAAPQ